MDFFQRQDAARRNTKRLVLYFGLAVAGIVLSVYLAAIMVFAGVKAKTTRRPHQDYPLPAPQLVLWNPKLFGIVSLGVLAVIGCGSAYKMAALSAGGRTVAESLGGRLVNSSTTDPDERKLLNIVEEMSIASGVAMPQVFVLDGEPGINAFAAGHSTSDAAVAVTRGCIQSLNRDELQGVIGHEFSHILNGDMRLNLRLMGIIFGIVSLVTIGRILLRVRSSGKNQNPLPILGLVLILIGGIGAFFASLIQAAVSRQREFLADAAAVQFTRNPGGLSGALQKIGGAGSVLDSDHAAEASHMFFCNGLKSSFFNAFATHPPLEERIRVINPTWDGKFKAVTRFVTEEPPTPRRAAVPPPLFGAPQMAGFAAATMVSSLGNPTPLHLRYAEQFREAIPEEVRLAVREPSAAAALVFALLLDADPAQRRAQLAELAQRFPAAGRQVELLARVIENLAVQARLPLVNLALPVLRELRPADFHQFSATLTWLVESDGEIDLFEFALQKIVQRHLAARFGAPRRAVVQYYSMKPLLPDCAVLLSALAHVGHADAAAGNQAFRQGAPYLRASEGGVQFVPGAECGLDVIDAALNRLDQAAPQIKKNLLEACTRVVGADGVVQGTEAELLRAIAETLDCPMPPFVTAE